MTAEMVSSAVTQEAVNQVLSRIKEGYQDKTDAKENIERMEMAHIKLEAALETSNKWNVTSVPLLRWRSKLKRASQECDNTLRRCRQRLQEEEEVKQAKQDHHYSQGNNCRRSSSESLPCDMYLEPVIQVYLLGHVALSAVGGNILRAVADGESKTSPVSEIPYFKLGLHFFPHAPYEDLSPGVESSATEMINGVTVKHGLYAKICSGQLGDFMIPKAVDYLLGNEAATSYQMLWKSKHGGAYLQVEKISWGQTAGRGMAVKRPKQQQGWSSAKNRDFLSSWIAHTPANMQGAVMDSVRNEKRLPRPLLFRNIPCVDHCPIILVASQFNRSLARKIKSCSMFKA